MSLKWARFPQEDTPFSTAWVLYKEIPKHVGYVGNVAAHALWYLTDEPHEWVIKIWSRAFKRGYLEFFADYPDLETMQEDVLKGVGDMYEVG